MPKPTSYDPIHITQMLKYFIEWPAYIEEIKEIVSGGRVSKIKELKPNIPPTLNRYALNEARVHPDTLKDWTERDAEFLRVYAMCKAIQNQFVLDRGMLGEYNSAITKFMLVNHSDMRDKTESEQVVRTESVEEYLKRIATEENN